MPTYEYYCKACDHEWEREQRISDAPLKTCPRCKARKAKRMISQTSFVLKGSGWYSDLYSSSKDGGKTDGDAKPEATGGGDAKKDAKDKGADKSSGKGKKSGSGGGKSKSGSKAAA